MGFAALQLPDLYTALNELQKHGRSIEKFITHLDIKEKMTRDEQTSRMRSEEHPSELQSLMRISYAVFCLKKKRKKVNLIPSCIHTTYQRQESQHKDKKE